jgi:hypothetical protein
LAIVFRNSCPSLERVLDIAREQGGVLAALWLHIDRDRCQSCRSALSEAAAASVETEHPTSWELILAELGLLSGDKSEQVLHHSRACDLCSGVAARDISRRLATATSSVTNAGRDWKSIVAGAGWFSLTPQAVYSTHRPGGQLPLARLDREPLLAVVSRDSDADVVVIEITVSRVARAAIVNALVITETSSWEGQLPLQKSGTIQFGSAVLGPAAEWVANGNHLSVLVWLDEGQP